MVLYKCYESIIIIIITMYSAYSLWWERARAFIRMSVVRIMQGSEYCKTEMILLQCPLWWVMSMESIMGTMQAGDFKFVNQNFYSKLHLNYILLAWNYSCHIFHNSKVVAFLNNLHSDIGTPLGRHATEYATGSHSKYPCQIPYPARERSDPRGGGVWGVKLWSIAYSLVRLRKMFWCIAVSRVYYAGQDYRTTKMSYYCAL